MLAADAIKAAVTNYKAKQLTITSSKTTAAASASA
jgi:hypothetical protein